MSELITSPNFRVDGEPSHHAYSAGDRFYDRLIDAHRGLSDDESRLLNARLILLLANHIGDLRVLEQALAAACDQERNATRTDPDPTESPA